MANQYLIGTTITIKLEFLDDQNLPVDPAKISLIVEQGKGRFITKYYNTEIQDFSRISQGVYELIFTPTIAAVHTVTSIIKSKNGNQDTNTHQFSVIGLNEQARKELKRL